MLRKLSAAHHWSLPNRLAITVAALGADHLSFRGLNVYRASWFGTRGEATGPKSCIVAG